GERRALRRLADDPLRPEDVARDGRAADHAGIAALRFVGVGPVGLLQPVPLVVDEAAGLLFEVNEPRDRDLPGPRTTFPSVRGELLTEQLDRALDEQALAGGQGTPLAVRDREASGQDGLDVEVGCFASVDQLEELGDLARTG